MNHREIIIYASAAVNYNIIDWKTGRNGQEWAELDTGEWWNPVGDDGDAFRLMVDLDLSTVMLYEGGINNKRREFWSPNSGYGGGKAETTCEDYAQNSRAATRMAISLAAASIGKYKQGDTDDEE